MSIIIMERLASYQMQYGWVKDQRAPSSAATKQSTKFLNSNLLYIIMIQYQIYWNFEMGFKWMQIFILFPWFWIGSIEHNNSM